MRSGIDKGQGDDIIFNQIDQKPVRFNVALAKAGVFPRQRMIPMFLIQLTALTQDINHCIQFVKIKPRFFMSL